MDTLSFLVSHNPLFYTKVTWLCTLVWLSHEFVNLRDATRQDRGGCSSPPLRSSLARLLFLDQMHLLRCYTSPELCHRGLNEIGRTVSGGAGPCPDSQLKSTRLSNKSNTSFGRVRRKVRGRWQTAGKCLEFRKCLIKETFTLHLAVSAKSQYLCALRWTLLRLT